MKVLASVLWVALTLGFLWLARELGADVSAELAPFEPQSPRVEIAGEGFHIELDVAGTPLDEPFAEQRAQMEAYVAEVEVALGRRGRRAAWLCYTAAAGSLLGLWLTWSGGRSARAAA